MSTAVGSPVSRKDGVLKITGQARYAADHPIRNVAHAVALVSTIGRGRITAINSDAAEKAPGFLAIIHHGNAPRLYRSTNDFMSATKPGEVRVVFEDDRVHYAGQYVAVVVAETLQQAQFAASLVKIKYEALPPVVEFEMPTTLCSIPQNFFGNSLPITGAVPAPAFHFSRVKTQVTDTTRS